MNTLRKGNRTLSDAVRSLSQKVDNGNDKQDYQTKMTTEIKTELHEMHIKNEMSLPDLSGNFPAFDNSQIIDFLSRINFDFDKKLKALVHLCKAAYVAGMTTKQFSGALAPLLFTRQYLKTHKWPLGEG